MRENFSLRNMLGMFFCVLIVPNFVMYGPTGDYMIWDILIVEGGKMTSCCLQLYHMVIDGKLSY